MGKIASRARTEGKGHCLKEQQRNGTDILAKSRAGWAEAQPAREDQDHELTIKIIGGLPE